MTDLVLDRDGTLSLLSWSRPDDLGGVPGSERYDTFSGSRGIRSSLLPAGMWVLSDAELTDLGSFLAYVDANFPVPFSMPDPGQSVLLSFEIKLEADGSLAVKQIRPLLLSEPAPPSPTFELEVPAGTVACGVFSVAGADRGPREEYELKSMVRFRAGTLELPTRDETFEADLVEELLFGPAREVAEPLAPGLFRVTRFEQADGRTTYRFVYEQQFSLADGRGFLLSLVAPLEFQTQGDQILVGTEVLDEEFFTVMAGGEAFLGTVDGNPSVRYGSCRYDTLPSFEISVEVEDGTTLLLEERFEPPESEVDTGPASLVRAVALIGGEERVVSEYWNLVYSAFRHNEQVRYWIVFENPAQVPGVAAPVKAVEVIAPEPGAGVEAGVVYLGEDFDVLARPALTSYEKTRVATGFSRGDADTSGRVDVADAVVVLDYLFLRGSALACEKSADVDDNGGLNLVDAIYLLGYLFRKVPNRGLRLATAAGTPPLTHSLVRVFCHVGEGRRKKL